MTSTDKEGRNIRKVKFSERSRLVEIPGYPGHVVNLDRGMDGLVNFLLLQGHTKREIQRVLKELERKRTVLSPRRYRGENRQTDPSLEGPTEFETQQAQTLKPLLGNQINLNQIIQETAWVPQYQDPKY